MQVEQEQLEYLATFLEKRSGMIGGNVKGLLDDAQALSLPVVTDGVDSVASFPRAELVHEVHYKSESGPFVVSLYKARAAKSDDGKDWAERSCKTCSKTTKHEAHPNTAGEERVGSVVVPPTVTPYRCTLCNGVDVQLEMEQSVCSTTKTLPAKSNGAAMVAGPQ